MELTWADDLDPDDVDEDVLPLATWALTYPGATQVTMLEEDGFALDFTEPGRPGRTFLVLVKLGTDLYSTCDLLTLDFHPYRLTPVREPDGRMLVRILDTLADESFVKLRLSSDWHEDDWPVLSLAYDLPPEAADTEDRLHARIYRLQELFETYESAFDTLVGHEPS